MLSRASYAAEYVGSCRNLFDNLLAAYESLTEGRDLDTAAAFEISLARHLIVVLDAYFVHRARGREKKDGNPLNEVRMLRDSILENGCVLAPNSTIKYRPDRAVLGHEVGDSIDPSVSDVALLAAAYFREIEEKYADHAA